MTRSQYGPAAGTKKGPAPRLARIHIPAFVRLEADELEILVNHLRDPLAHGVYTLLKTHVAFDTGEVPATTYAHLQDMLHPPQPERGRRRPAPTYDQLRRVLADLESAGLLARDRTANAMQGQLRTFLPLVAAHAAERKNKHAQRLKAQGLAQGQKPRKPA